MVCFLISGPDEYFYKASSNDDLYNDDETVYSLHHIPNCTEAQRLFLEREKNKTVLIDEDQKQNEDRQPELTTTLQINSPSTTPKIITKSIFEGNL